MSDVQWFADCNIQHVFVGVTWFQDTIDFPCDTKAVVRSIWAGNFFDVPRGLHFDAQAHRLHLHARDEQRTARTCTPEKNSPSGPARSASVIVFIRILDVCQGGTESKSSTRYATRVGAVCKGARTRGSHSAAATAATANAATVATATVKAAMASAASATVATAAATVATA